MENVSELWDSASLHLLMSTRYTVTQDTQNFIEGLLTKCQTWCLYWKNNQNFVVGSLFFELISILRPVLSSGRSGFEFWLQGGGFGPVSCPLWSLVSLAL